MVGIVEDLQLPDRLSIVLIVQIHLQGNLSGSIRQTILIIKGVF